MKTLRESIFIPFLATYNKKLKSVSVKSFTVKVDDTAKLPCLEYFHVTKDANEDFLTSFLNNHPSIVTFCHRYAAYFPQVYDVLLDNVTLPNLRPIKIGGELAELKSIFERVKADPKRLETLEMIFEKISDQSVQNSG